MLSECPFIFSFTFWTKVSQDSFALSSSQAPELGLCSVYGIVIITTQVKSLALQIFYYWLLQSSLYCCQIPVDLLVLFDFFLLKLEYTALIMCITWPHTVNLTSDLTSSKVGLQKLLCSPKQSGERRTKINPMLNSMYEEKIKKWLTCKKAD